MKKQLTLSDLKHVKGSLDESAAKKTTSESYNKKHKASVDCVCESTPTDPVEF